MTIRHRLVASTAALLVPIGGFFAPAVLADSMEASDGTPAHRIVLTFPTDALEEAESRQLLHARVQAAARRACGPVEIKDFHVRRTWKKCYDVALADAMEQVRRHEAPAG